MEMVSSILTDPFVASVLVYSIGTIDKERKLRETCQIAIKLNIILATLVAITSITNFIAYDYFIDYRSLYVILGLFSTVVVGKLSNVAVFGVFAPSLMIMYFVWLPVLFLWNIMGIASWYIANMIVIGWEES